MELPPAPPSLGLPPVPPSPGLEVPPAPPAPASEEKVAESGDTGEVSAPEVSAVSEAPGVELPPAPPSLDLPPVPRVLVWRFLHPHRLLLLGRRLLNPEILGKNLPLSCQQ